MRGCSEVRIKQSYVSRKSTRENQVVSTQSTLQLSGAWAFYESRHQEDNEEIERLKTKVSELETTNGSLSAELGSLQAKLAAQKTATEASEVERENFESQLQRLKTSHSSLSESYAEERTILSRKVTELQNTVDQLQNKYSRLQDKFHTSSAELSRLEADLYASQESERSLVDKLESADCSVAEVTGRNLALERENAELLQQRMHHVNHAELLMKEKNRYFTMLTQLKRQQGCVLSGEQPASSAEASKPDAGHQTVGSKTAPAKSFNKCHGVERANGRGTRVMGCIKASSAKFNSADAIREAQRIRASSAEARAKHTVLKENRPA